MSGIATAVVAGAVISGAVASRSASKAADAQQAASQSATDTQLYQYNTTRDDQAPWRAAGEAALARLNNGLQPAAPTLSSGDKTSKFYHPLARNAISAATNGQFSRRFTADDLNADPVYNSGLQFGLDEGRKARLRAANAGGEAYSGATLKALTRYANDYGSTKAGDAYNRFNTDQTNAFNRNASVAGLGQTANSVVASAGQNMANNVSANQIGAGNARASGYIGQANAITGAIGQGINQYQDQQYINRLSQANAPSQNYADEMARLTSADTQFY